MAWPESRSETAETAGTRYQSTLTPGDLVKENRPVVLQFFLLSKLAVPSRLATTPGAVMFG